MSICRALIQQIEDLLADCWSWRERFPACQCLIAGDLNIDLDASDTVSNFINSFISQNGLNRCDSLCGKAKTATYVNEALNHHSTIDYFITSNSDTLVDFEVIDPNINFSDHLPILATVACKASIQDSCCISKSCSKTTELRWDHADLVSYSNYTDHGPSSTNCCNGS